MLGRGAAQLLSRGVWPNAVEEHTDLKLPALQVGAQDRWLIVIRKLDSGEVLAARTNQQPTLPAGSQVAHPLRVTARRDEVALTLEGEEIHRRTTRLTGGAPCHLQHARAEQADAQAGQAGHGRIEHSPGEPAGTLTLEMGRGRAVRLHTAKATCCGNSAPGRGRRCAR